VVRVRDNSPQIYSVNTDYTASEDGEYALPVKLYNTTTVTVSNIVTGTYADLTKPFTYVAFFKDANEAPIVDGTFAYTGGTVTDGAEAPDPGTLPATDANGKTTFTLNHGQSITIADIPIGSSIRIALTNDGENPGLVSGYTTSFKAFTTDESAATVESGADTDFRELPDDDPRTFAFTNNGTYVPKAGIDAKSGGMIAVLLLCLTELIVLIAARRRIARR
jgi:hypothetical protein